MLSFVFTDIYNEKVTVKNPLSMTVNIEQGVPADDMTAVFPYFSANELKDVVVYKNDKVVFTGVVDEQQSICSAYGQFKKIAARSMAALLLDNESEPVSYNNPSSYVIASRHALPFGVKLTDTSVDTYFGVQTVQKGSTNWQAIEDFSKNVYMTTPRVNERGELSFKGIESEKEVVFSNSSQDGISYTEFTQNIKRCEEISRVCIKVTNSCGYHSVVENPDAINRGIDKVRYLNSVLTDTPAVYADNMIKNSRKKAYVVTLECPGCHLDVFANSARITDSICGEIDSLYVCSVHYTLNHKEDVTKITLKRKDV